MGFSLLFGVGEVGKGVRRGGVGCGRAVIVFRVLEWVATRWATTLQQF